MTDAFEARDEGMGRVARNNSAWLASALDHIFDAIPVGWTGTGEDLRHIIAERMWARRRTTTHGAP